MKRILNPLTPYLKVQGLGDMEDLSLRLWGDTGKVELLDETVQQAIILEQYKLYVEMADRISFRRLTANSFFLTLNTAVMALFGALWNSGLQAADWRLTFPLVALLGQCLTWFWTIRSYRQLNTAKWAVVGAMEERLPAAPYSNAEWYAVGEGKDPSRYWPVTHIETWIPLLFALSYVGAYIGLLTA